MSATVLHCRAVFAAKRFADQRCARVNVNPDIARVIAHDSAMGVYRGGELPTQVLRSRPDPTPPRAA